MRDDGRNECDKCRTRRDGFDPAEDTSGWMRATSPSGSAEFEGIVAWAGELGYGVRAPERGQSAPEVEPAEEEDGSHGGHH